MAKGVKVSDAKLKDHVKRAKSLVVLSSRSGAMSKAAEAKIRDAFPTSLVVEFDPNLELEALLERGGRVVVAGGDGSVGWVVRRLAETSHPLGIIPMGTFNNFAKSLDLPTNVDRAIEVIKKGRPRPITLGKVNGHVFLEAAALGLFGDTIAMGESAKDRAFGAFLGEVRQLLADKPFTYTLAGDLTGSGVAMSLVFINTTSIGAQLTVGDTSPRESHLEFAIKVGASKRDVVGRLLRRVASVKGDEQVESQVLQFRHLEITTKPRVRIYADNQRLGSTPAVITAELSALRVFMGPRPRGKKPGSA